MKRGRKPQGEDIGGVWVGVTALQAEVWNYGRYLRDNFSADDLRECDDDTPSGDMRLQVHGGSWRTWEGDSQYDTDHRGAWGCGFVPRGVSMKEARTIARDMIAEAASDYDEAGQI